MSKSSLVDELVRKGGIDKDTIVHLSVMRPNSRHTPYLDILPTPDLASHELPDVVIEQNGFPIMYLVHVNTLGGDAINDEQLKALMKVLASRGDARLLGIVSSDIINIYPIMFIGKTDKKTLPRKRLPFDGTKPLLREFLANDDWHMPAPSDELGGAKNSRQWLERTDRAWLEGLLFRLLDNAAAAIVNSSTRENALPPSDVLSLIGRALFVRFLNDRDIITQDLVEQIAKGAKDRNKLLVETHIAETFAWLDNTFNGDLLTLGNDDRAKIGRKKRSKKEGIAYYQHFFDGISSKTKKVIFHELVNILHGTEHRQPSLFWKDIKFRHVPADLLSQVYERFYRSYNEKEAKKTSVVFTPRRLAAMVLDGCFSAMESSPRHKAKILDPSAGGGVFLSLALRRLVQERWKKKGRPNREAIRKILNEQVFGFDVNKDALKVAALGLYLTALELDPDPHPPEALTFDYLFDKNLYEFNEASTGDNMGSLSEIVRERFAGWFDIVTGNPPWTPWGEEKRKPLTQLVRNTLKRHVEKGRCAFSEQQIAAYESSRQRPDTPFVWRSTELAKEGGGIGFLLHSRLLFQQTKDDKLTEREYLFRVIHLTGVMDGSSVHQEAYIWPNAVVPFMFLVAKNKRPDSRATFSFLSLHKETKLNKVGRFRVDSSSTYPIPVSRIFNTPHLLKSFTHGSILDVNLVSRLQKLVPITLGMYFEEQNIEFHRGFQPVTKDGKGKKDATPMLGLPIMEPKAVTSNNIRYRIDAKLLERSTHTRAVRSGDRDWFYGPLVLFREKGASRRTEQGALYCDDDLFFNRSFYGISFRNMIQSTSLAGYLTLLSYSRFFFYYPLMTSSKFGVERRTILHKDYLDFPFIPYELLRKDQQKKIGRLSKDIETGKEPWDAVDELVAEIYDLSPGEQDLVHDAYEYELPFADSLKNAEAPPGDEMAKAFCKRLKEVIAPKGMLKGKKVHVDPVSHGDRSNTWRFFRIKVGGTSKVETGLLDIIEWATQPLDVSQIRFRPNENGDDIIVGQLAQARYWTQSRAWLMGLEWHRNRLKPTLDQG